MPLLYFVDPETPAHRILRAVLSWSQCNLLVDGASAVRIPDDPAAQMKTEVAFYVGPEEANQKWSSGLYGLNLKMSDANESLRVLQGLGPGSHE
jgi:hypothetical protein